ncbi:hypothetical protein HN51_058808, partial [Arachis hypogaea]
MTLFSETLESDILVGRRSHFAWMAFHVEVLRHFFMASFFIFVRLPIVGILFEIYTCFVLFSHLSKCSSIISLFLDGLCNLFP